MMLAVVCWVILHFYNLFSYSAIQPQVCNKLSVTVFRKGVCPVERSDKQHLLIGVHDLTWANCRKCSWLTKFKSGNKLCLRKNVTLLIFCDVFVRCHPILLIFGTNIPQGICSIPAVT